MYSNFQFSVSSLGLVSLINTSKNYNSLLWKFPDGSTSTDLNPTKQFTKPGKYYIQLEVKNSKGEMAVLGNYINVSMSINPQSRQIVNIPIDHDENLWEDISGYGNNGSFNGKINQLTNQGLASNQSTFSSIKLPGCNVENLNERIKISNSESFKNIKEVTFSASFALDKTSSMSPNDGSCGPNGRQVLFSKGGDGFGTSLPGFNSFLEIKNNNVSLNLEFSKNSGDFNVNIPIDKYLDTVKIREAFEVFYLKTDEYFVKGVPQALIKFKFRSGEIVDPFQHIVISFSENSLRVFINEKTVFNEFRSIKFDEMNNQDLFIGAMGPKSIPVNKISNWYPFKGRIDKIIVLDKLIDLGEAIRIRNQ